VAENLELRAEDRAKVVVEQPNLEKAGVNLPLDRLERLLVRRLLEDDEKQNRGQERDDGEPDDRVEISKGEEEPVDGRAENGVDDGHRLRKCSRGPSSAS
jgi:hypothetical protein